MTTQECKRCSRRLKVLVNGICAYCDPDGWVKYHNNKTGKGMKK